MFVCINKWNKDLKVSLCIYVYDLELENLESLHQMLCLLCFWHTLIFLSVFCVCLFFRFNSDFCNLMGHIVLHIVASLSLTLKTTCFTITCTYCSQSYSKNNKKCWDFLARVYNWSATLFFTQTHWISYFKQG